MNSATYHSGISYGSDVRTTMNPYYPPDISIHVGDELSRFLRRYGRYIADEKALSCIITNLDTVPVIQAVIDGVERRRGLSGLKGMEIRASEDVEDPGDVTLEIVLHVEEYGERISRVWDELCDAAERAASRSDTLTKVCIVMIQGLLNWVYLNTGP
ncbi:MAG: hypothetical protein RMJ59_02085 [Candidatus Nitrosocaldus sp.]|nr:hypothetical protein [Candidatus Nitrosocaldus sp.]MCS7141560.1 hypothetical protein [Candidatus Nitrosocaldus sp.]MDW8000320.1 hypothetical protein [Candidatus Nitrosocaldus sp.]MDW8275156.1 hypothetical protein [Candidatus Nitrosocaldus sp.]